MVFDIRRLDIYRKIPKDLTQPTWTGAFISICCCLFIVFLFLVEFVAFITTEVVSELYVDDPVSKLTERIPVNLNISLMKLKCDYIGLDIQDDLGRHEVGFVQDTKKNPINDGEGCLFEALFQINKVPGNFHVSTHAAGHGNQPAVVDMSHIVHHVIFGSKTTNKKLIGSFNPLHDFDKSDTGKPQSSYDYFVKVVPTVFEDLSGRRQHPYQYTFAARDYTSLGHGHAPLPAIWFRYDLSPITVKYTEKRKPFYHFLTTICAIVGGTFTVAGIIDSCIFTAAEIFKKAELGKLS